MKNLLSGKFSNKIKQLLGKIPSNRLDAIQKIIKEKPDTFAALTDFTNEHNYTFSSGVVVQGVTSDKGSYNWGIGSLSGATMEYDSTAFNGKGGIAFKSGTDYLHYDSVFTAQTDHTIFFVVKIPDYSAAGNIIQFGRGSNFGNADARLIHVGEGLLRWGRDEANGFPDVANTTQDGTFIIAIRTQNHTTLDVFVDRLENKFTIDPKNVIDSANGTSIWLGSNSSNAGVVNMEVAEYFHVLEALSDNDIRGVFNQWRRKYIDRLYVLANGQSLQDDLFSDFSGAGDTAFLNLADDSYRDVFHTNAAQGGSFLVKSAADAASSTRYWWDDTTSSKGVEYTSKLDPITNKDSVDLLKYNLGTNDKGYLPGTITKVDYKAALQEYFAQIYSDFGCPVMLNPYHREQGGTSSSSGAQMVREAQLETIDEVSYVYRGIEIYDLDQKDVVHLNQAGNETMAQREVRRIQAILGKSSAVGTLGPEVTGVSVDGANIDLTITHDAGTDLTVPTGAEDMFAVDDNGAIEAVSSVSKVDSNTVRLTLSAAPTDLRKVYISYGTNPGLSQLNPAVIVDNATNAMPLQSKVMTV